MKTQTLMSKAVKELSYTEKAELAKRLIIQLENEANCGSWHRHEAHEGILTLAEAVANTHLGRVIVRKRKALSSLSLLTS